MLNFIVCVCAARALAGRGLVGYNRMEFQAPLTVLCSRMNPHLPFPPWLLINPGHRSLWLWWLTYNKKTGGSKP